MFPERSSRFIIAAVGSIAVHIIALAPIQVSTGAHIVSATFQPLLNVHLYNNQWSAIKPVLSGSPAETELLDDRTLPSSTTPAVDHSVNSSLRHPNLASFGNGETQTPPVETQVLPYGDKGAVPSSGVRMALPHEVRVRVRLYDAKADDNPNEIINRGTGKYFYFNAPGLKQPTHPLADARPHYPAATTGNPNGTVVLLLLIDEEGQLEKTLVACANPTFEESAMTSVREMRFRAGRDANGPVKSYMMVEFGYGRGDICGKNPYDAFLDKRAG